MAIAVAIAVVPQLAGRATGFSTFVFLHHFLQQDTTLSCPPFLDIAALNVLPPVRPDAPPHLRKILPFPHGEMYTLRMTSTADEWTCPLSVVTQK